MLNDFRHAARRLRRSPGFTATAVLSLALGLGAGVAAFSVIDSIRFRALPFPDGNRLVLVSETATAPCRGGCPVSYETYANLLATYPFRTVDLVAGYTSGGKALNLGGEPVLIMGGVVSPNLFQLLQVSAHLGRLLTEEDNHLGAELATVLSYDLWVNQLGADSSILGRTLQLSDSRYTVVGITPPGFDHEAGSRFWLPAVPTLDPSTRPSIRHLTVIARLRPGFGVAQFRTELGAIDPAVLNAGRPRDAAPVHLDALPLRDRYTASTQSHDLIFAAVVACILLIAAANLANMVLVRAIDQQREMAVRAALGAGQGRLIRQLASELVLLVAGATVLGMAFADWLLAVLRDVAVLASLRPGGMEATIDVRAVLFGTGLAAVFAAGLTLAPARLATRLNLQSMLRQGGTGSGGRGAGWLQRGFVVGQIAGAVVLGTGAVLMARTVIRLAQVDLGFDAAHVIEGSPSFPHPWRVREKFVPITAQIATELRGVSGVEAVGIRASTPLGPRGAPPVIALESGAPPLPDALVPQAAVSVDTGYFRALGAGLLRGRDFSSADAEAAPQVAILNQWAADRWWPGADPIGRAVLVDTAPGVPVRLEVVGVVRNHKAASGNLLLAEDGPELYRPLTQAPSAFPTFVVRAAAPGAILKPVKDVLVRLVPDRPLSATIVADRAATQLAGVRVNAWQILGFAVIGVGLALLGVYGIFSYVVGRRTREIGIRGALGAGTDALRWMILRDTALLALAGVVLGIPLALAGTRILGPLLHGTPAADPVALATVGTAMIGAALLAGLMPARRAARVDPVVALRAD